MVRPLPVALLPLQVSMLWHIPARRLERSPARRWLSRQIATPAAEAPAADSRNLSSKPGEGRYVS